MASPSVTLRPVRAGDTKALNAIHIHYVQNTVITFMYEPFTDDQFREKIKAITDDGWPYIVAVDEQEAIVGYTSCSRFRSTKLGYQHTVEISLFCHPEHCRRGVGAMLLNKLLEILRDPSKHPDFVDISVERQQVRQVLACMAIDTTGPKGGLGLKEFYERFGFVERGHLFNVGFKFGKW